jgi:hypothetical protein
MTPCYRHHNDYLAGFLKINIFATSYHKEYMTKDTKSKNKFAMVIKIVFVSGISSALKTILQLQK